MKKSKPRPIHINIAFERNRVGMTQKEVTLKLGLSSRMVSAWERGTKIPKHENLLRLADLYGCDVEDFYDVDFTEIMALGRSRLREYLWFGGVPEEQKDLSRHIVSLCNSYRNDVDIESKSESSLTTATDLIHLLEPIDDKNRMRIPLKDDFIPVDEHSSDVVKAFILSQSKEVLVYGARSCGKTARILMLLLWYCENCPGIQISVCRSEHSGIGKTILASFKLLFKFPYAKDKRNPFHIVGGMDKPTGIRFNNGSYIGFVGLRDGEALKGLQSHVVFMNQGERENTIETFSSLGAGSVGERAGPLKKPPGHNWSFRLIVDANPDIPIHWLYERSQTDVMETFHFTHKDHPHYYDTIEERYTEKGVEVREDLKNLYPPGHMRDRMLDGLWVGSEGLVLQTFDPAKHILPKEKQPTIESNWLHYRSTDWAFSGAHVTLWISTNPETGISYVWQEYAKTETRVAEHGEFIKNHSRGFEYVVHLADSEDASARAEFADMDLHTTTVEKDLRIGINTLNRVFAEGKLFIFEGLNINNDQQLINKKYPADLLAEIAQLRYPEQKTGGVDDYKPDPSCKRDRFDALRYFAVYKYHYQQGIYLDPSVV